MPTDQHDDPPLQPCVIRQGHVNGWRYDIKHAKARHEQMIRISVVEFEALLDLADEALLARAAAKTGESVQ
jgi:hypothetical protein